MGVRDKALEKYCLLCIQSPVFPFCTRPTLASEFSSNSPSLKILEGQRMKNKLITCLYFSQEDLKMKICKNITLINRENTFKVNVKDQSQTHNKMKGRQDSNSHEPSAFDIQLYLLPASPGWYIFPLGMNMLAYEYHPNTTVYFKSSLWCTVDVYNVYLISSLLSLCSWWAIATCWHPQVASQVPNILAAPGHGSFGPLQPTLLQP